MCKTSVYLSERETRRLAELTRSTGRSQAEIIRDERGLARRVLIAHNLITWTKGILLTGELARSEPKPGP